MRKGITIIIPVYNADRYLKRCLDSVLKQSYTDWELVLVDDGSSDKSSQICDEYALNDSRISVIHKQNSGAGAARNDGIAQARGDYVVFVDADDYIETNYLEQLSKHTEDVVFIDVQCVDEKGRKVKEEFMSRYKNWTKDDLLRSQMTGKLPWGGVRKAVRRILLTDKTIR